MQRVKFVNDCNGVNIVQNTQFDSISSRSGRLGQPHSDEGNVFLDTPVNRPEGEYNIESTVLLRAGQIERRFHQQYVS